MKKLSLFLITILAFQAYSQQRTYEVDTYLDTESPIEDNMIWGGDRVRTRNILDQTFHVSSFPVILKEQARRGVIYVKNGQLQDHVLTSNLFSNRNNSNYSDGEPICAIEFDLSIIGHDVFEAPPEPMQYQNGELVYIGGRETFIERDYGSNVINFNLREPLQLDSVDYDAEGRTTSDGTPMREKWYEITSRTVVNTTPGVPDFVSREYNIYQSPIVPVVHFYFTPGQLVKKIKCFKTFRTYNRHSNNRISLVRWNPNNQFDSFIRSMQGNARNNDYGVSGSRLEYSGRTITLGNQEAFRINNERGETKIGITVGEVRDTLAGIVDFEVYKMATDIR